MQYEYPPQPISGKVPDWFGAPDWAPGEHNPMKDVYHQSHGRALGDSDSVTRPDPHNADGAITAEERIYPNELNLLSELDDISGNGIFDPANTQAQIHPDAGVFASHASQPGYLARERPFMASEVLDINTGKQTVYTPANAFYLDPRTPNVLQDLKLYEPGMPNTGGVQAPYASTWIPDTGAQAIGETAPGQVNHGMKVAFAITGIAVGIFAATLLTVGKRKSRKR